MNRRPVRGPIPQAPKINPGVGPQRAGWLFSFEFWDQIENFGLDKAEVPWFISLLKRLRELSRIDIDDLQRNPALKGIWRYHEIDWNATNIPIQRNELTWLPSDYRDNNDEFPMYQFQISKARGRIVGFWGIDSRTFYIVLIDHLHNLQPSKKFDYRVDPCSPLSCKHTELLLAIDRTRQSLACSKDECLLHGALATIVADTSPAAFFPNAVVLGLDAKDISDVNYLLSDNRTGSINEILKRGIQAFIDDLGQNDEEIVPSADGRDIHE